MDPIQLMFLSTPGALGEIETYSLEFDTPSGRPMIVWTIENRQGWATERWPLDEAAAFVPEEVMRRAREHLTNT